MAGGNEKPDLAVLSSLCGQVVPGQPWLDVLKSMQRSIPPHKNPALRISPQLSMLALAVVRAGDLVNADRSMAADLMVKSAKGLNMAIDFGVPVTESDLVFLREKFGQVARLSEVPGVIDTPESVFEATAGNFDLLLTHRGPQNRIAKKKPGTKSLWQLVGDQQEKVFDSKLSPICRLRQAFNVPLILHYNPHLPDRQAQPVLANQLKRPVDIERDEFLWSLQNAIRQAGGQNEVVVHGIRVDVKKTLALQGDHTQLIGDLNIPQGVKTHEFQRQLFECLRATKEKQIEFHGHQILVQPTLNLTTKRRYMINELPLPHTDVDQDFFNTLNAKLSLKWSDGQTFDVKGLKIMPAETKGDQMNMRAGYLCCVWVDQPDFSRVVVPANQSDFNLQSTKGSVVVIADHAQSTLTETLQKFSSSMILQGLTRTHTGLVLNGAAHPVGPLSNLAGSEFSEKIADQVPRLVSKLSRVTGADRPGRDQVTRELMDGVAAAIGCGEQLNL